MLFYNAQVKETLQLCREVFPLLTWVPPDKMSRNKGSLNCVSNSRANTLRSLGNPSSDPYFQTFKNTTGSREFL